MPLIININTINMAKKILLIEDDVYLLNIYVTKLQKAGFECLTAESGEKGLELAQEKNPDLILLDILFPGKIGGFEVLQKLKAEARTSDIPVFLLTNLKDDKTISNGLKLGALGYFIKTATSPDDIIKSINNFI